MGQKADDIEEEIDAAKRKIEGASTAITEKLELLDHRLRETAQELRRNFDIRYQVARYPWPLFAGSVLAGFLLGRRRSRRSSIAETAARYAARAREALPERVTRTAAMTLHDSLKGELSAIKGLAVGAVLRTALGMLRRALMHRSAAAPRPAHGHNGGGPVERRY